MFSSTIDPRRLLLAGALVLAGVLQTAPAHAEPDAFVSEYRAGKTALQSGAFRDALDHFRLSLREAGEHQAASWKGMIGVAYAFRGLEEPGHALEYYRRFLAKSALHETMLPPKWRARRGAVEAEVAELENLALETHAMVPVTSAPAGARITVDGLDAGADGTAKTPYPLYLKPGEHTLSVSLEGYEAVVKKLTVVAGELVPMTITLSRPAPAGAAAPETTASGAEVAPEWQIRAPGVEAEVDLAPYILLSSGGVAALTAIGLTVGASLKHQQVEQLLQKYRQVDQVKALTGKEARDAVAELVDAAGARDTMQLASNVFYGVGIAAVIGGVIWMLATEEDEDAEDSIALRLVPVFGFTPTPQGAMTSATWRF